MLVSTDEGELIWFHQVTEELRQEPPHLEEIFERLEKAREKEKLLKQRGKKNKKSAMAKILGRNMQLEESESKTELSTGKKNKSKRRQEKKKSGKFGLLKHLEEGKNTDNTPVGVIEEADPHKSPKKDINSTAK